MMNLYIYVLVWFISKKSFIAMRKKIQRLLKIQRYEIKGKERKGKKIEGEKSRKSKVIFMLSVESYIGNGGVMS